MPHSQPVVSVTASDGHRFDLIHVPAALAQQTILFIPGMGLSARQYIRLGQALAERGIESYIHEWRGIGSSDQRASRDNDWGYRELLDIDLAASLAAIRAVCGNRRLLIGGHSLGSQFACLLAGRHTEACQGIALVAGGAPFEQLFPWWGRLTLFLAFRLMPAIGYLIGHYPGRALRFAGREARGVIADWTRTGRTGHYNLPGLVPTPEAQMLELTVPVLATRMADDWFVPEASLKGLTDKLPACQITSMVINSDDLSGKADHFAWLNSADVMARTIADHFR